MADSKISAVLGPTNTGKTHLAVERMCAHSSGMMGFPLRLLAREIYDRVVRVKGVHNVALLTGEERIMPRDARWLLCTTESIPMDRDVAFAAIDEVQLATDPERGHIFTDRMLNLRGREETMLLGSQAMQSTIRALIPQAEVITRPRFSKLSFTPPKKLSRLPIRSAIVAFSIEEVYAIAEQLRQTRGGAAVVMGALSPRTRNAQVKMYEEGDVDYLVATDAIGMGLNMDVSSVYFASLTKFDGRRQRRLSIAEMGQIAGRAGRHQHDGSFGTLTAADRLTPEEIDRLETHHFPKIDTIYWREAEPDYRSLSALIASLERAPNHEVLRAAPEASDLEILKILANDHDVSPRARSLPAILRLWEVCRLPDFQKLGPFFHAKLVARIFLYLTEPARFVPEHIFADQLARLDSVQGDVAAVAARIAVIRTWAYVAQRGDWLADPGKWRTRTAALEEKLSDALHAKLTERFVDRRTKALLRGAGVSSTLLDVRVESDGTVLVEEERIGQLNGFTFSTDPLVPLVDRKMLLAAADKHLARELSARGAALSLAADHEIQLATVAGEPPSLCWRGISIATLQRGKSLASPAIVLDAAILKLARQTVTAIEIRCTDWLQNRLRSQIPSLLLLGDAATQLEAPHLRSLVAQLADAGGSLDRDDVDPAITALTADERRTIKRLGIVIGSLDIFHPAIIKPEAARWRAALMSARKNTAMPPLPMPGLGLLDHPAEALAIAAAKVGYRRFGNNMLRIDLVERIARRVHEQRTGRVPFRPDEQMSISLGIGETTLAQILRALGFTVAGSQLPMQWKWRGIKRSALPVPAPGSSPFSALAALKQRQIEKITRD